MLVAKRFLNPKLSLPKMQNRRSIRGPTESTNIPQNNWKENSQKLKGKTRLMARVSVDISEQHIDVCVWIVI